jgi:ribosome maturation factor RimP
MVERVSVTEPADAVLPQKRRTGVRDQRCFRAGTKVELALADALLSSVHHISPFGEMGARRPFFLRGPNDMTNHEKERELYREIALQVERGLPGVEVLALELAGPERFCVYVDHPTGVDHALCERVTNVLRRYLERYTVDVSSPGLERPLRKPAHFKNVVGRRVAIRTGEPIDGRKRFRGELVAAGSGAVSVHSGAETVDIPYDAIVRGNLIDEG